MGDELEILPRKLQAPLMNTLAQFASNGRGNTSQPTYDFALDYGKGFTVLIEILWVSLTYLCSVRAKLVTFPCLVHVSVMCKFCRISGA